MFKKTIVALLLCVAGVACGKSPPLTIEQLQQKAFEGSLKKVRSLPEGDGYSAYLVSYISAGLTVHAMIGVPEGKPPAAGFPVLIANHGHHPEPARYGITSDDMDSRPGDYYRRIPELFAAAGFLVIMPDYRGHSDSEGFEYTDGMLEASYYAEDVLALIAGLDDIEQADLENVFMWGHSMGGDVSLRALVATDRVKAASLWSSVGGDIWDQSYYYSRYENPHAADGSDVPKTVVVKLRDDLASLGGPYDSGDGEPLNYLDDLQAAIIIHHAVGDTGAAYKWSERLAKELYLLDHPYRFYSYPGNDHLFAEDMMRLAVERDVAFFRKHMATGSQ